MIKEETLKKIKNVFDLNIYEVKIWTALLSKGTASAGELAEISHVPRSRSYDVLETLERKGFVVMKLGKPIRYIAIPPKEILERVKKHIQEHSKEKLENLGKVKDTELFHELELLYKNGIEHLDLEAVSGAIKGRKNIYSYIDYALRNARERVCISTTTNGFFRKMTHLKETLEKLKKNKVKIKIAVPVDETINELVKDASKFAEIKNLKLGARFVIVDGKEIVFMITDDDVHETNDSGIWVKTPYFAKSLEQMFEMNWNRR